MCFLLKLLQGQRADSSVTQTHLNKHKKSLFPNICNKLIIKTNSKLEVCMNSECLFYVIMYYYILYFGQSPGKNTGVGFQLLFQGIFPTLGSNPGLLNCMWILYHLSHKGNPYVIFWEVSFLEDDLTKIHLHIYSHWLILGVTFLFEVHQLPIDVFKQDWYISILKKVLLCILAISS